MNFRLCFNLREPKIQFLSLTPALVHDLDLESVYFAEPVLQCPHLTGTGSAVQTDHGRPTILCGVELANIIKNKADGKPPEVTFDLSVVQSRKKVRGSIPN